MRHSLRWIFASFLLDLCCATRYIYDYKSDGGLVQSDTWSSEWGQQIGRVHTPQCVDIPANLTLCRNIGYDKMRLPNLLDHDTMAEVTSQSSSWVPLLNRHCHPDTQLFLCSLFSPVCLEKEIWPCRSLCSSVRDSCSHIMKNYGYPWPDMLKCDRFPLDNDLCIKQITHNKDDDICSPCKQPDTFEGIIDNYCQAEFVIRAKITGMRIEHGRKVLTLRKKKKFYKKHNMTRRDRIRLKTLYIAEGDKCNCSAAVGGTKSKFLIMGRKLGEQFEVTCFKPWMRKNREFKRAVRSIKREKDEVCKKGVMQIAGEKGTQGGSTTTTEKGKGKDKDSKKKGRKDKKRKGKKKNKNRKGRKDRKNRKNRKNRKDRRKDRTQTSRTTSNAIRPTVHRPRTTSGRENKRLKPTIPRTRIRPGAHRPRVKTNMLGPS